MRRQYKTDRWSSSANSVTSLLHLAPSLSEESELSESSGRLNDMNAPTSSALNAPLSRFIKATNTRKGKIQYQEQRRREALIYGLNLFWTTRRLPLHATHLLNFHAETIECYCTTVAYLVTTNIYVEFSSSIGFARETGSPDLGASLRSKPKSLPVFYDLPRSTSTWPFSSLSYVLLKCAQQKVSKH